jgi:hypothetical protein
MSAQSQPDRSSPHPVRGPSPRPVRAGHRPISLRKRWFTVAVAATFLLAPTLALDNAGAAMLTFGSPLSVPATEDTASNLNYTGTDVPLPGSVFHIPHDAADSALWNVGLASGNPIAPAGGQVVSVSLEGCAKSGGPPPLTQIHFQVLSPLPGGGAKVELTSQAFEIPVCAQGGASGATVSTYRPTNLCVAQGDYVDFNDEGGFLAAQNGEPPPYPSGVPYMVIGAVSGSTMDSFIRNNGTGNGASFSPTDTSDHDGFASNPGEELMLEATLATGPDATPLCPGGSMGVPAPGTVRAVHHHAFPALTIPTPQLDGMNARGVVGVAIYCHSSTGACTGTVTLHSRPHHDSRAVWLGAGSFSIAPHSTGKARVHLSMLARRMVRRAARGLGVEATLNGDPLGAASALSAAIAVHGA